MLTNADITIYNKKYNSETRSDTWHRTVLEGVHFYCEHKVQLLATGLVNADLYKIRVPLHVKTDKQYVPQDEYQYQAAEDVSGLWTIQKGDYIVRGAGPDVSTLAELQKLICDTCKVTAWSDNRRGGLPHWRIEGV